MAGEDAPKVEEFVKTFLSRLAGLTEEQSSNVAETLSHMLRPYFPPASQTPHYPKYLKWALDYIADGADYSQGETPIHDCEFSSNPEKGGCAFHENFFEAVFALTYVATPASTARTDGWVSKEVCIKAIEEWFGKDSYECEQLIGKIETLKPAAPGSVPQAEPLPFYLSLKADIERASAKIRKHSGAAQLGDDNRAKKERQEP